MGDPYLSSNESLILSTYNICIDGMSLDLMLTSRRLILIDNSVNPFHLRTILLESIITVFAGINEKGDPIITMSHMDPSGTGAPHPMDIIFTRQKGEQRAKECNEWAATLIIHAAGARNEALSAGTLPYDPVKVIQPRMSATYRIETFSPRKPVMEAYPVRTEPVTTPVLPKSLVEYGIPSGIDGPAPLKNAEMVEPFDSSRLPSPDLDEMEMPDIKEPVPPPQVIPIEPDKDQAITDAEEPVSPPQVIAIEPDKDQAITDAARTWADAVRTVTTPLPTIPLILQCPADDEPEEPSAPKAAPVPAAISPPAPKIQNLSTPPILIAAIIVVILVVLGVAVIGSFNLLNFGETPPSPVVSIVTIQPAPTPLPALVPADGVWVRIEYPGTFIGEVGNTELMHPVSGSGVQIYKMLWSNRVVQASAQKQENSGDTLLIEVYNNGTLIKRSSTRAPMGSVNILIDPITGQPPGIKHGDIP
ncbi:MAG: hypothetical protein Q8N94_03850 [Methanoregula sp.]|nr:hypothetical protein [Methanoregula sp.]